ncbi:MAG: L,D-transpeptidase [Actinomycetota bacterium]|nr:L,D-transpeptidase [Actinomycetota bacterium]
MRLRRANRRGPSGAPRKARGARGRGPLISALAAGLVLIAVPVVDAGADTAIDRRGPSGPALVPEARGAAGAPEPDQYAPAPGAGSTTLSDEWKRSTWAYVEEPVTARSEPRDSARAVKRLSTLTSDRTPELVLALVLRRDAGGAEWVKVRLPMRPNNTTGWVRRGALGAFRVVRTALRIDRRGLGARLYRGGRMVWHSKIGIGKRRWPTPAGRFYIRERLVPARRNSIYGVFAFGTSAYSPTLTDWPGGGVIGIHGTNQPGLIPGRISHGCVRVRNGPISRLRRLMPLGTPVRIY